MNPAEYQQVALGLFFLKHISDAFEERRKALQNEKDTDPPQKEHDKYTAESVFCAKERSLGGASG